MKRLTNFRFLPTFFSLILFFSSCEGPEGEPGPKGDTGPKGEIGAKGDQGNANVRSYIFLNKDIGSSSRLELVIPAITQEVLDKDVIMVFMREKIGSNTWLPLPWSTRGYYIELDRILVGKVVLRSNFESQGLDYRVVLLSASTNTNLRVAPVDLIDFEEVQQYYHLKE